MTTVTLVAPYLDAIERQLDRDIALLLKHAADQSRWEADLQEPLLVLLEEHHRVFSDWRPAP